MIKHRIASTAALATFGLAALGAIALAAPGNADTGTSGSSSNSAESTPHRPPLNNPTAIGGQPGSVDLRSADEQATIDAQKKAMQDAKDKIDAYNRAQEAASKRKAAPPSPEEVALKALFGPFADLF